MQTESDIVVVGAGVSGLALASALSRRGRAVTVVDKGRGVGGRCATRRVEGVPLDHGVPYLHGRTRPFLQAIDHLCDEDKLRTWPSELRGNGTPCQPQAYRERSRRVAPTAGVSALPKAMAHGLDVRLNTRVEGLDRRDGRFVLACGDTSHSAPTVVLTPPVRQTAALLNTLGAQPRELVAVLAVMERVFLLPCLTVMAGYRRPPLDDWELWLPGPKSPIHSLINDSSKRADAEHQVLVVQADPRFSRRHFDQEPDAWAGRLLAATADLVGDWADQPAWSQAHRWRYARVQRGNELSHPVLMRWGDGATLGLCGEAFNPNGGVEGALLSGLEMAGRIDDDNATAV